VVERDGRVEKRVGRVGREGLTGRGGILDGRGGILDGRGGILDGRVGNLVEWEGNIEERVGNLEERAAWVVSSSPVLNIESSLLASKSLFDLTILSSCN
jgi:hypothetical protein